MLMYRIYIARQVVVTAYFVNRDSSDIRVGACGYIPVDLIFVMNKGIVFGRIAGGVYVRCSVYKSI